MKRRALQGNLAHMKTRSPRTHQQAYAWRYIVVLRGWAFCYERGIPIQEVVGWGESKADLLRQASCPNGGRGARRWAGVLS